MEIHERQFKADCDEKERRFKTETDEKNRKFQIDKEAHDQNVQKWRNFREWLTLAGALAGNQRGLESGVDSSTESFRVCEKIEVLPDSRVDKGLTTTTIKPTL